MTKLKEFRKSQGLSQEKMAQKMGITVSMYEKVENKRTGASATFMKKLKTAFPTANIEDIFFAAQQQQFCSN